MLNKDIEEAHCSANVKGVIAERPLNKIIPMVEDKLEQETLQKYQLESSKLQNELNNPNLNKKEEEAIKDAENSNKALLKLQDKTVRANLEKAIIDYFNSFNVISQDSSLAKKYEQEIKDMGIPVKLNFSSFSFSIPSCLKKSDGTLKARVYDYAYNSHLSLYRDGDQKLFVSEILSGVNEHGMLDHKRIADIKSADELMNIARNDIYNHVNEGIKCNDFFIETYKNLIKQKKDSIVKKYDLENRLQEWREDNQNYILDLKSLAGQEWNVETQYVIEKVDGKFRVRVL